MNTSKYLFSVIVPIYNQENNLNRCLDSLISQYGNDIEFILVNDGSTDNSLKICYEYAKKDKRFKIYSKKNGGLSSARNEGMKYANGKYFLFVDSDDFILPHTCKVLRNLILQYDPDIINFEFFENKFNNIVYPIDEEKSEFLIKKMTGFEAGKEYLYGRYSYNSIWSKLCKAKLFENITFPHGMYAEDLAVTYKLLSKAETVIYINEKLYFYVRYDTGSIMADASIKLVIDTFYIHKDKYDFELKKFDSDKNIIETSYTNRILKTIARLVNEDDSQYSNILSDLFNELSKRNISITPLSTKICYYLLKINVTLFAKIMKKIGLNG